MEQSGCSFTLIYLLILTSLFKSASLSVLLPQRHTSVPSHVFDSSFNNSSQFTGTYNLYENVNNCMLKMFSLGCM